MKDKYKEQRTKYKGRTCTLSFVLCSFYFVLSMIFHPFQYTFGVFYPLQETSEFGTFHLYCEFFLSKKHIFKIIFYNFAFENGSFAIFFETIEANSQHFSMWKSIILFLTILCI